MKYLILIATAMLCASGAYSQDTCKTYSHKNPHGAAMTISRVWVLDSVNFRVESIPELPFQETASGTYDFKVCILARDGQKHSTQVRYQTTHGPVSYNITNFVAPLGTSGVEESSFNGLRIYPNPTTGVVNVSLDYPFEYSVVDINGVTVLAGRSEQAVDLSALANGSYFLTLEATGHPDIVKRIVKR